MPPIAGSRAATKLDDASIDGAVERLDAGALVVRVRGALDPTQAAAWAAGVHRGRAAWTDDFKGAQHSLGRAWYTHLEQGRAAEYFAGVAESDAAVERYCPGLQACTRALVSRALGEPVVPRSGWCGPGVHVFPAGARVARRGGDVHFDTEGLTPAHAKDGAPAYTFVLMLAPPASGGGLRVWDVAYAGSDAYEDEDLERESVTVDYGAGDLAILSSYRLHQIQPFSGAVDRVSITCHAAFVAGAWETWF